MAANSSAIMDGRARFREDEIRLQKSIETGGCGEDAAWFSED